MAFLDTVLGFITQNKAVCVLSVLLFAFFISTIALAVQKNNLASELATCEDKDHTTPANLKHRLPSNVVPTHYDLFLHPDLDTHKFTGTVTISFKVTEATQYVILNAYKLTIESVAVHSASQEIPTSHELSEEFQSLVVSVKSGQLDVTTGDSTFTIAITFSGSMEDKNIGLYSSKYKKTDDSEVTISSSKFQPTYARQAFPCFDEPEFKATYSISLVRPKDNNYIALSNMPEESSTDGPGSNDVTVKFKDSPQMSTYLAVFLVADFINSEQEIENIGGDNFNIRVYLPEGQQDKGTFALDAAVRITKTYIEYFNIGYPLPKLDMAAIPDYVSGATEHWGLVTFRETSLLWDEAESSTRNKQRVASVISHELAHMWFGNLVTCKWWNDVWLNEGFASYIEYKGLSTFSTDDNWKMEDQFLIEDLHGVMELDSKVASHPIVQEAETPDEITALFDSIAYSKGASIIRMMEGFLTSDVFKSGVNKFLTEFRYKSVVTADFFRFMDTEAGYSVTDIMSTWTEQKGYPVVTVKRVSDTTYELTQERFLLNTDSKADETDNSPFRWHIPITYVSDKKSSGNTVEWFKPDQNSIQLNMGEASKWIKVNQNQVGYYIVNYDDWSELVNQMKDAGNQFSVMDRAQLLHDAFKLADSMTISYTVPLDLTTYLLSTNETDYVPWSVVTSKFSSLYAMLDDSLDFYHYITKQIQEVYAYVNPVNINEDTAQDHLKKLLREKIMNLACSLEHSQCMTYVRDSFKSYQDDETSKPDPDIRQTVYYHGMKDVRGFSDWNAIYQRFVKEIDPQERAKLMEALAATQSPQLLTNYLNIAQDKNGPIKKQDYVTVMQYIANNKVGESIVWEYVKNNWETITTEISDINDRTLGRMIPNITKRFNTAAQLQELEQFFAKHPEAGAGAAARLEALETIKYNIKWREHNKAAIDTWLKEHLENSKSIVSQEKTIKVTDLIDSTPIDFTQFTLKVINCSPMIQSHSLRVPVDFPQRLQSTMCNLSKPTSQLLLHSLLEMVHNPASLVRPSSVSNFSRQDSSTLRKSHSLVLSLATICVILAALLCIVVAGLVLVGRNLSRVSQSSALSTRNFSGFSSQDPSSLANRSILTLPNSVNPQQVPGRVEGVMASTRLSAAAAKIVEQLSFRLPAEVRPKRYNLHLHPNLVEKTFSGNVSIDLEVSKPVSFIAVHTKKLTISSTSLTREASSTVPLEETFEYEPLEYWVTVPKETIGEGVYQLNMSFNGSLINRIVGFYASSYFNPEQNQTRTIATSKFEPTYARQSFPCLDEPAMKAPFKISIVRPTGDNYISLSNMNEEKNEENGAETVSHFAESVPMSTYLACFIVCDFLHKAETVKTQGIGKDFQLKVYATPNQLNKTEFALKTGVGITEFYIQYFQIEYPLPKLDMIAIPDFVSGAMETWGLITYRETALLYDPLISSSANKQRVAEVVAHELSHMWFGNLVTMRFWNDLWLNEGFASYIQYKGCDHLFPSWGMMDQFLIDDLHYVFRIDGSLATHPIVQSVANPDQITEMFDAISYSKGASIIRMLEDMIGSENFRNSVTRYLTAHKYGNADTNDLLTQVEKLNLDYDIKYVMDTWTRQGGFPVVTVEQLSNTTYKLTQKRFFSNPENDISLAPPSEYNYRWYIPITYVTDRDPKVQRKWFPNSDTEAEIVIDHPHDWIKINKDQIGYYYVNYPADVWSSLTRALIEDKNVFSVSDRSQLLNDVFYLADSTQTSYEIALNLTKYLKTEDQYVPWVVVTNRLLNIYKLVDQTDVVPQVEKYCQQLLARVYESIGWTVNEDDHLKNRLRGLILQFACAMGHKECLSIAGDEFKKWLQDPSNRPHPDLRSIIYSYGMQSVGDKEKWDQVWKIYLAETDAQEKTKLMSALTSVKDHSLLNRLITLCWDEKNVRGQDYFSTMSSIASNSIGRNLVWDYVREHWEDYVKRFGLNERYLGRMIPAITKNFNSNVKLEEMKAFFTKYPEAGAGTAARKEALENVSGNIKWLQNNKDVVTEWFKNNSK
ncbi:uncharacterized protein LOC132257980 [Phlebotomus argentipes]|uniref:uncharacterized protein LOC132257980 n=1 Tax=Phlebotomus argentipes TaxID=94469 RepID=UPI00289378F4|nr:uncharacterized protein LOC132257980 [Phlebotomus argentipes]